MKSKNAGEMLRLRTLGQYAVQKFAYGRLYFFSVLKIAQAVLGAGHGHEPLFAAARIKIFTAHRAGDEGVALAVYQEDGDRAVSERRGRVAFVKREFSEYFCARTHERIDEGGRKMHIAYDLFDYRLRRGIAAVGYYTAYTFGKREVCDELGVRRKVVGAGW